MLLQLTLYLVQILAHCTLSTKMLRNHQASFPGRFSTFLMGLGMRRGGIECVCVQLPATLLPAPPPSLHLSLSSPPPSLPSSLPPFQNLEMIKVAEEEAQALAGTIRKKTYKGDVEIETDSQDKIEVLVIPLNYLCMYQVVGLHWYIFECF